MEIVNALLFLALSVLAWLAVVASAVYISFKAGADDLGMEAVFWISGLVMFVFFAAAAVNIVKVLVF